MSILKLIATVSLAFVTACQSSPEKSQVSSEPKSKAISSETQDKIVEKVVVETEPKTAIEPDVLLLLLKAEIAIQRQQYEDALEFYLEASKLVDDVRVTEKAARIGLFLDDLSKTDQAASLWLKQDSKNMMARRIALSTALSRQDKTAAIEHLNVILKEFPAEFGDTLLEIQKALKTKKDFDFTLVLLDELEKQHPQQAAIFLSQSILAIRQKNYEIAREKVTKALTFQPEWENAIELEAELFLYSGKLAFKNKDYAKALEWFDKIKRGTQVFDASMASISVLFQQKNYTEANIRLENLLKENPSQRMRILIMQAELQSEQKNYQQAFDILTEALKETPEERDLLYTRALTAEKLDDLATLETDLLKILKQTPKDVGALNAMGYTLADKTTRYDEAEIYLKQAIKLQPEEAVILDSYGWLKFKQGDLKTALEYLQKAYEKRTEENEIVAHLAEVLWQLNKKEEASKLIKEAMEKSPDDEYLLDFKARILDKQ